MDRLVWLCALPGVDLVANVCWPLLATGWAEADSSSLRRVLQLPLMSPCVVSATVTTNLLPFPHPQLCSVRYGTVVDAHLLRKLLTGKLEGQQLQRDDGSG